MLGFSYFKAHLVNRYTDDETCCYVCMLFLIPLIFLDTLALSLLRHFVGVPLIPIIGGLVAAFLTWLSVLDFLLFRHFALRVFLSDD